MKRIIMVPCLVLLAHFLFAQGGVSEAFSDKNSYTLNQRYAILRDKTPSYRDYKEIKTYALDSWWKIVLDSIKSQKALYNQSKAKIVSLENQLAQSKKLMEEKEGSMEAMLHAGTHINALGFDFSKTFFITLVSLIVVGLLTLAGILVARLKWIQSSMREKIDSANRLSIEFEDYKRKALDKQMKLSRELQNERNKLSELRN